MELHICVGEWSQKPKKARSKQTRWMSKRGWVIRTIPSYTPGAKGPKFQVREARSQRSPTGKGEHWAEGSQIPPHTCFPYFIVPFGHNCSINQRQQGCGSDLHLHHNYLVGLSEHCGCPAPSFSDSADVGWGPRICISKESQVMLDAGLRPPCHTHWCWIRESRVNFLS